MSLKTIDLFGKLNDKVEDSLERIKSFCPEQGYYLAFSGGKDSIVVEKLLQISTVKYDSHYNLTTIDPPELVRFIKDSYPEVQIVMPEKPFLKRLEEKGFPTRQNRWCCAEYKEKGGHGRIIVTGIRWAESLKRSHRRMFEVCYRDKTKRYLNPIIEWTDEDVWEFIRYFNLKYPLLYDEGFKRIGCLMCPMAGRQRKLERSRYPIFERNFIKSFERLYQNKNPEVVKRWRNGREMFDWWMSEKRPSYNPDQMVIFE